MSIDQIGTKNRTLRVLLIQTEYTTWMYGKKFPYCMSFGIEDGLHANGIEVFVVTSPWLPYLAQLCAGKTFDQVWLNFLNHFTSLDFDLSVVKDLADVRIGFINESVEYYPDEYAVYPHLKRQQVMAEYLCQYATHLLPVDEYDAFHLHERFAMPTMWNPCSIPEERISIDVSPPSQDVAFFSGSIYGKRVTWLEESSLQNLLDYQPSTNNHWLDANAFNLLHISVRRPLRSLLHSRYFPTVAMHPLYLNALRHLRRKASHLWHTGMQQGFAVVNLPHLVKCYSSRVIEGIAAGRPVVSWRIPDRPLNQAMFEDGKEILLYDTPEELAAHIEHLLSDPDFGAQIAANGQRKVKQFHTTEKRIQQILHWVETGEESNIGITS